MLRKGLIFVAALAAVACAGDSNLIDGHDGSFADGSIDGSVTPMPDAGPSRPDAGPDDAGQDAGPPIELVDICDHCTMHEQCGPLGQCVPLTNGEFACTEICNPDIPSCPRGFECVRRPASPNHSICVPVGVSCCVDEDADGYGQGVGCLGLDCDDSDPDRSPQAPELCNLIDDDCDGAIDEDATDCGAQRCVLADGVSYEEYAPGACVTGECVEPEPISCGLYTCSEGGDAGDFCATTCERDGVDDDSLCIAGTHCDDGVCVPDEPNGSACDEDSDCQSGRCDNGFCCDDGRCCSQTSDCPNGGSFGATCDDTATCQGSRGEVVCMNFQCTTREGIDDDSACDDEVKADDCGYYLPIYCTGEVDQSAPVCPTSCTDDSECDEGAHCDRNGECVPDLPDGETCEEGRECISGHCNNNICCSGGDCCTTPADCPASYSRAPTCDSPSTCQGTRDAAICVDHVCGTLPDVPDDSACTSDIEALTCGLYPSRFCSGGTDQMPPMCATSCTADSECIEGAHCKNNICRPNLDNGQQCDADSECKSGHCQNGFCCDSGDCCASASDCSPSTYGEPSECNDAASCQGTRRDPVCVDNQCAMGPPIDDDSGCAGRVSNDCGLYPSVMCTSMPDQPSDQAALCPSSCSTNADCDPGAYCMDGQCHPRGMPGDACTASHQCQDGTQCVDGVCCTSACTGTCMACNVPGSLGTCSPIPANTDPDGECGAVSCSDYFWGWSGNACYRHANAPASAVSCNGAGACQTAEEVCPSQPRGAVQIECDATCQDTRPGTCTGTTPGACNNRPSGTQTCGVGACERTVAECNAGTPVECVPGTPQSETCDGVDNDCDGSVDEGLSGDQYEPNNTCGSSHSLTKLWTQAKSGQPASQTISPTIYGAGDIDVFRVAWEENDSSCGCGSFSIDEDYALVATLTVPSGAGSYQLCGSMDSCSTTSNCITVQAGATRSIEIWKDGCCSPIGCKDTGTGYFTVRGQGSPAMQCMPYTLKIETKIGCR